MLKNNIIHSRNLIEQMRKYYTGFYLASIVNTSKNGFIKLENPLSFLETRTNFYDNCFSSTDKITPCSFIIIYGYLYQIYLNNVTGINLYSVQDTSYNLMSNLWTDITGCTNTSSPYINSTAYGIYDGKLYKIVFDGGIPVATQVGSATNWIKVAGVYNTRSDYTLFAYGIAGGKLYKISNTTVTQVGSLTNWTFIQGSSNNSSDPKVCNYGIAGGKLYKISNTTATQIGTDYSDWSEIRGQNYGLALRNGYLYYVNDTTVTQVGTSNGWTDITDRYAINNGKLFKITSANSVTQVGTSNGWTDITGHLTMCSGIKNSRLYDLEEGEDAKNIYGVKKIFYSIDPKDYGNSYYKILAISEVK